MISNNIKTITALTILVAVLGLADLVRRGPATLPARPQTGITPATKYPKLIKTGEALPELRAEAILIKRLNTGEIIYERNADAKMPIASLTKLMTALILAEIGQPLELIEFSSETKKAGSADDNRSQVIPGDRLRAEDVLKLLLVSSSNDAAYAAAEYAGRVAYDDSKDQFDERVRRFVGRMNERASDLGLVNTHFANPSGRDHPENFSTATDITGLGAFLAEHYPQLWAVSRIQETFIFGDKGHRYGLVNTNPLLAELPAIYGSKTGFDQEARGALIMLYQLAPGDLFSIVILRSQNRFDDGRSAIQWLESNFAVEFVAYPKAQRLNQ